MNKTLELLKKDYKPIRVTLKGNTTILETMTGKYLVKKKDNKNIKRIYNYLKSRNFDYYPKLIEDNRDDVNVYEYIEDFDNPKEQKASDMVDIVSLLHSKTTYFKTVSEDKYKEIYESVLGNINYLSDYYNKLFSIIDEEVYMSPSHYLLILNSSKILSSLYYAKEELESWYELVRTKNKQRVCLVHNNLRVEHFLKQDKGYLVSWENAKIDTPILDLVNFYRNEYFNIDFESVLNKYLRKNPLSEDEQKLFYILIALVDKVDLNDNEFESCKRVRKVLDYLIITENLIRPYNSKKEKEE